jgi:DNA-binding CsgD family transcriptional regulator/PAS domain-containing protein
MGKHQDFSHLVAGVYDTTLDAGLWPDVLARVADFVDGRVSGLLVKDSTRKCVEAHCHAGGDPHYMQLYADTYSKVGPVATSLFCDAEQVVNIPELMPYEEFCRGCFYREWAEPQGWVDVAIAVLEKSASGCAYLSVARDKANGMVDDEMRQRMALVVPHVRRAVLIGKAIDFKHAEAATFADILDGMSAGLFVIDAGGRIVHTNAAGTEILGDADFLRSTAGRLVASDAQIDQVLRETLAAARNGDAGIGVTGIALPFTAHNGDRYVAHVLPLTSGERRLAGAAYTAVAALFVRRAAMDSRTPPEVIGKTYNLTPTELRVLFGIVEIGGVPEVADALGVAHTTVKTHLGRLFEKTRTGRQADLVKLVAGFATPLAN